MALFITLGIVWPVAIIGLLLFLLCVKSFYAAIHSSRAADAPDK